MRILNVILYSSVFFKKSVLIVLLFISLSCFSEKYEILKEIKATSNLASYSIDSTKYSINFKIIPNAKFKQSNNGLRIICDKDSVHFSYYTNIDSLKFILKPNDTVLFKVKLNNTTTFLTQIIGYDKSENYSDSYIKEHTNTITIDIPEVNELIKIILLLNQDELTHAIESKSSEYKEVFSSDYYKDVLDYFYKFRKEKIIDELYDFIKDDSYLTIYDNYTGIKRFASLYEFNNENKIIRSKYYVVEANINLDLLEPFLQEINDFSDKTHFRDFYKTHLPIYKEAKELYMKLLPVNSIWNFTEKHFSHKVQHYKIIYSPLESFYYYTTNNYDKKKQFNQYTYYAATPIWEIGNTNDIIFNNYITNSYSFFKTQLFQYMDDFISVDTFNFEKVFKNKNKWMFFNVFNKKNDISSKIIFYTYLSKALYIQYYNKELKAKFNNKSLKNYDSNLLYEDKFDKEFSLQYKEYGFNQFDLVINKMIEWCKKQK